MERAPRLLQMPDARDPRWVRDTQRGDRVRVLGELDSAKGIDTTWIQNLTRKQIECIDGLMAQPLTRIVRQTINPPIPEYHIQTVVEEEDGQENVGKLTTYAAGRREFERTTRDPQNRVNFSSRNNQTGELETIIWHKRTRDLNETLLEYVGKDTEEGIREKVRKLAQLATDKGGVVFYANPGLRGVEDPEEELEDQRASFQEELQEKMRGWTEQEKREVTEQCAIWTAGLWEGLLPERQGSVADVLPDMTNRILETLPFGYETKGNDERSRLFLNAFGDVVDRTLAYNAADVENMADMYVTVTFGRRAAKVEFDDPNGETHTTSTRYGRTFEFNGYKYTVDKTRVGVAVAAQRVVRPVVFEYKTPLKANIDLFSKTIEVPTNTGWEDAAKVSQNEYVVRK